MKNVKFNCLMMLMVMALNLPSLAAPGDKLKAADGSGKLLLAAGIIAGATGVGFLVRAIYKECTKTDGERAQDVRNEFNNTEARYRARLQILNQLEQTNNPDERKELKKLIIARAKSHYDRKLYPLLECSHVIADDIWQLNARINWLLTRQNIVPNGVALYNDLQNLRNALTDLQDVVIMAKTYDKERNAQRKQKLRANELNELLEKQRSQQQHGVSYQNY